MKHKAERMQILRQTPLGPMKYSPAYSVTTYRGISIYIQVYIIYTQV